MLLRHSLQGLIGIADALLEGRENLCKAVRLRSNEGCLHDVEAILLRHAGNSPRNGRDMPGQLTERHGLRMRLPRQFVRWDAIEQAFRNRHFRMKLLQHGSNNICSANHCCHLYLSLKVAPASCRLWRGNLAPALATIYFAISFPTSTIFPSLYRS